MDRWMNDLQIKFNLKRCDRPALRALVAIELVDHHDFVQSEVGKRLGISQAAVSYYLTETRGQHSFILKKNKELMAEIHQIADRIAGVKTDE